MQVDEVQKKTELAKVMVENGLAANTNEALEQIDNLNIVKEQISVEQQETPEEDRLKKVETVLDDVGKYFLRFKDNMNNQIQELRKDLLASNSVIDELKRRIEQLKLQRRPVEEVKEEEPKQETLESKEPENKSSEKNQRVGAWKPEDVSIEEFFSNANGKMMKK